LIVKAVPLKGERKGFGGRKEKKRNPEKKKRDVREPANEKPGTSEKTAFGRKKRKKEGEGGGKKVHGVKITRLVKGERGRTSPLY